MKPPTKKLFPKEKWIWMPHPGHFCGSFDCRFHLNTYVGGYIVSTVGEYYPDSKVREILGRENDRKFEEIGLDRLYETMVFEAVKSNHKCCPYEMRSGEKDFLGYTNADDAYEGHLTLCKKWSKKA